MIFYNRFCYGCFMLLSLLLSQVALAQRSDTLVLYHAFDRYGLTAQHYRQLDSILAQRPGQLVSITIEGATDPTGTAPYNAGLAWRRAAVVRQYLVARGVDSMLIAYSGICRDCGFLQGLTDRAQRRTMIVFGATAPPHAFRGAKGTEVVTDGDSLLQIAEYADTDAMLRDGVYAIDTEENILQTAGMIRICREGAVRLGGYYEVKIPGWYGEVDTTMRVWNGALNNSGQLRWSRNDTLRVTYNQEERYYLFRFPVNALDSCLWINLDVRPDTVIYMATERAVPFYAMQVTANSTHLRFAARLNDSLYAFVRQRYALEQWMVFEGRAKINGIDSLIRIPLSQCLRSRYDGRPAGMLYTICDACLQLMEDTLVATPPVAAPAPKQKPVKKRGFFAWLRRVFGGK